MKEIKSVYASLRSNVSGEFHSKQINAWWFKGNDKFLLFHLRTLLFDVPLLACQPPIVYSDKIFPFLFWDTLPPLQAQPPPPLATTPVDLELPQDLIQAVRFLYKKKNSNTLYIGDKEASGRVLLGLFLTVVTSWLGLVYPSKRFMVDHEYKILEERKFATDEAIAAIAEVSGNTEIDVVFVCLSTSPESQVVWLTKNRFTSVKHLVSTLHHHGPVEDWYKVNVAIPFLDHVTMG